MNGDETSGDQEAEAEEPSRDEAAVQARKEESPHECDHGERNEDGHVSDFFLDWVQIERRTRQPNTFRDTRVAGTGDGHHMEPVTFEFVDSYVERSIQGAACFIHRADLDVLLSHDRYPFDPKCRLSHG